MSSKLYRKAVFCLSRLRATVWPPSVNLCYNTRHLDKKKYVSIVEQLQPGDVILTKPEPGLLGSLFITGPHTHAGLYVGKSFDEKYKHGFVHAVDPDARVTELHSILSVYSGIQVWRPLISAAAKDLACKRAKNTVNRHVEYDYDFRSCVTDRGNIADVTLYCSELIEFAYRHSLDVLGFYSEKRLGKLFYVPETFISKGKGFVKVLEVDSEELV